MLSSYKWNSKGIQDTSRGSFQAKPLNPSLHAAPGSNDEVKRLKAPLDFLATTLIFVYAIARPTSLLRYTGLLQPLS